MKQPVSCAKCGAAPVVEQAGAETHIHCDGDDCAFMCLRSQDGYDRDQTIEVWNTMMAEYDKQTDSWPSVA